MISNILRANAADKDAIALSGALLQSMVEDGNLPAREFLVRMEALETDLAALHSFEAGSLSGPSRGYVTSTGTFAANVTREPDPASRDASNVSMVTPDAFTVGTSSGSQQSQMPKAPLDAPFIEDFLCNADGDWASLGVLDTPVDGHGTWSWACTWDQTDLLQNIE